MAAKGRNIWALLTDKSSLVSRVASRTNNVVKPTQVNDTSTLPPATQYEGRLMWVSGTVKALYVSDGTNWKKVTVT